MNLSNVNIDDLLTGTPRKYLEIALDWGPGSGPRVSKPVGFKKSFLWACLFCSVMYGIYTMIFGLSC